MHNAVGCQRPMAVLAVAGLALGLVLPAEASTQAAERLASAARPLTAAAPDPDTASLAVQGVTLAAPAASTRTTILGRRG